MKNIIAAATTAFALSASGAQAISVKLEDVGFGIFNGRTAELQETGKGDLVMDFDADPIDGGIVIPNGLNLGGGFFSFTGVTPLTAVNTTVSFTDAIVDNDNTSLSILNGTDRLLFVSDGDLFFARNDSGDVSDALVDLPINIDIANNSELILLGTPGVSEQVVAMFANEQHWVREGGSGVDAPIPLPAAGWVLLSGAAALCGLAARRKREVNAVADAPKLKAA